MINNLNVNLSQMETKTRRTSRKSTFFFILFALILVILGITIGTTYSAFSSRATASGTITFAINGHKGMISIPNAVVRYDTTTNTNTFVIIPQAHYSVPTSVSAYILATEPTSENWNNAPTGWGDPVADVLTYSSGTITIYDTKLMSLNAKALYITGQCKGAGVTLTLNNNGSTSTVSAIYGQTLSNITPPTRTGYTFKGYFTGENGTGLQVYTANGQGTVSNFTTNTTIYAYWTINVYNINYTLNGGRMVSTNLAMYTIETPTFALCHPTRLGYLFQGWTGSNGTTVQPNVYITKGSVGDKEYTANWVANTFNISYNLNTGNITTPNPTSYNIGTETITLNSPTKTGYTFQGWTEQIYPKYWMKGFIHLTTGEIEPHQTSYPNSIYSFTPFYLKSGVTYSLSGYLEDMRWRTFNTDGTYYTSMSGSSITPDKNCYAYVLFYLGATTAQLNSIVITASTLTTTIPKGTTGDRKYTANYTANNYTLTYNLQASTVKHTPSISATTKTVTFDSAVSNLLVPTISKYYVFNGWYTDSACTIQIANASGVCVSTLSGYITNSI